MKKTDEMSFAPSRALMNWSAGRTVSAVVWTAPDTRPSTSPASSIIVPSTTVLCNASRAIGSVMPFARRSATMRST